MRHPSITRRDFLQKASLGFGGLALSSLYGAPLIPHYRPRAKNVIFLFMEGGVSQVDSFDYKPMLAKYHGKDPRKVIGKIEATQFGNVGKVMKSPWAFKQRGQCEAWISDLFPHMAELADELAIIRSMTANFPEHATACYYMHSGLGLQGRPSMGAWATYGLGSENENLPGYVVMTELALPQGGSRNWSNGFLPAHYQGTRLRSSGSPILDLQAPKHKTRDHQRKALDELNFLNERHAKKHPGHADLAARMESYELAYRMQMEVPGVIDLKSEPEAVREAYGMNHKETAGFGRQCLMARRLVEKGVRFIELTCPRIGGNDRWDAHGGLLKNHGDNARATDQPIAGLLRDLKSRGMLKDTLVVWSGEFGRTPFAQGSNGRDHNPYGFTIWMAGGGARPGITYGATDEFGYHAVENKLEIHDMHATMLHLLGMDHKKMTYFFDGRDMRLTDVHGHVAHDLVA